jgi:DNA gyrase subunit B
MSHSHDDIQVITWADAVRRRPAMYIPGTNVFGMHWLVGELLEVPLNPSRIDLCLREDSVRIAASAVPPSIQPRGEGRPPFLIEACTSLMTSLDAPPTLAGVEDVDESKSPAVFHRLGKAPSCLAIANALSAEFAIASSSQGKCSRVVFRRGQVESPLSEAATDAPDGLEIEFAPDREIFSDYTSFYFPLVARFARAASLVRRVR